MQVYHLLSHPDMHTCMSHDKVHQPTSMEQACMHSRVRMHHAPRDTCPLKRMHAQCTPRCMLVKKNICTLKAIALFCPLTTQVQSERWLLPYTSTREERCTHASISQIHAPPHIKERSPHKKGMLLQNLRELFNKL